MIRLISSAAVTLLWVGIAAAVTLPPDHAARLGAHQEATRARVVQVVAQLGALPAGPARRQLEVDIVQLKRELQIEFLSLSAQLARERGDEVGRGEAERLLALLLEPNIAAPAAREAKAAPRPTE